MLVKNHKYFSKIDEVIFPLVIFGIIWGGIFIQSGIFNAGFNYFVDDHTLLVIHRSYPSFYSIIIKPFAALFSNEPQVRFRPIYDVLLRLFTRIYGLDPYIWYLSSLLVAIVTSTTFYLIGRLQEFSKLESIGFASLIIFGQQASTYTRFGTPETTATLFIALAFLFASLNNDRKIHDYLFIIFALLAALNKEACILMLPALAYFKIWHLSQSKHISFQESWAVNKYNTIFVLCIFLLFVVYIRLAKVNGPGYAGIDEDTLSMAHLFKSLIANGAIFGAALIANIGYCITKKDRNQFEIDSGYILIALIIIPQLVIYNKTGMLWHYILPGAIGVSLLTFYPIAKIGKNSVKSYQIVTLIVLMIVVIQVIFTGIYFRDVSKRTGTIQPMISDIADCVRQDSRLVVMGNPYLDQEKLTAFDRITNLIIHNHHTILATYGNKNTHLFTDVFKNDEQQWYFLGAKYVENIYNNRTIDHLNHQELAMIKGIVLTHTSQVEKQLVALKLSWFDLDLLTKKDYPELDISVYCKN